MNPSLKEQLKDWKKQHREIKAAKKNKRRQKLQKPKSEHLSESDIKSLMGMGMPRFHRHRGALRQK